MPDFASNAHYGATQNVPHNTEQIPIPGHLQVLSCTSKCTAAAVTSEAGEGVPEAHLRQMCGELYRRVLTMGRALEKIATPSGDVWSAGILLCELITGECQS